jgi:hypothetical protein
MKIPILVMSGLLLGLTGTSAYLWQQLGGERQRAQQLADQLATLRARTGKSDRKRQMLASVRDTTKSPAPRSAMPSTGAQATAPTSTAPASADVEAGRYSTWGSSLARMLKDPSSRALMREQKIADTRLREPELARQLEMSNAEYEAFLALRVDQDLRRQESFSERRQSKPFDWEAAKKRDRDEIAKLLGDERLHKYDAYQAAAPDRATVRSLRGRLGEADALSDDQAASLASGLQEEREAFKKELDAQFGGRQSFTLGTVSGATFMASGGLADEDAMERQLNEQAASYRKRLVSRASTILTPRQLEVFEQMQDWEVAQQRVRVRSLRETPPPGAAGK